MYSVYWYIFSDYVGRGIKAQMKAKVPYRGVLYKIGHQQGEEEFGRVTKNTILDKDSTDKEIWVRLWKSIACNGLVKGFKTKEEAKQFEEKILAELGPKDFNLYENVSGISEFRIASIERKNILNKYFN